MSNNSDIELIESMKRHGFTTGEIRRIRSMQPAVQEKFVKALPEDFRVKYLDAVRKLGSTEGVRLKRLKQWLAPLGEDVIEKLAFVMKPNSVLLTY